MSRLIESIQVLNGRLINWPYHLERMRESVSHLFDCFPSYNFETMLREASLQRGKVKLRVLYDKNTFDFQFNKYLAKSVNSLKLIHDNDIDYQFKFEDRESLDTLYRNRADADDILIVKNEMITDSYYCNVALLNRGRWYTPLNPLLKGTKREQLIRARTIHPKQIFLDDLPDYSMICLFNAMIEFGEISLPVNKIQY